MCFCNTLYKCRCFCWRLLLPLWIIDLLLTIYIIVSLYNANVYACCTSNRAGIEDDCSYEDLGGWDNILVTDIDSFSNTSSTNSYATAGFCQRKDTDEICNGIAECAYGLTSSVDMTTDLCNDDVLDQVARCNWFWITAVLITKCCGLLFLIFLEFRSCRNYCRSKSDSNNRSTAADGEAEDVQRCSKCKNWGKQCCCKILIFVLKIVFMIFGTIATFLVLLYLNLTGNVIKSSCSCVSSFRESACNSVEDSCTSDENFYAVVFADFNIYGPYWADLVSNLLGSVVWCIRIAVATYYFKKTPLAV